jgi:hypothetical protein
MFQFEQFFKLEVYTNIGARTEAAFRLRSGSLRLRLSKLATRYKDMHICYFLILKSVCTFF